MSTLAKTGIHIKKQKTEKDVFINRTTSNLVFVHKLRTGESGIDLSNLNLPSAEMPTFVQPTIQQLSALNLTKNRSNVIVHSLSKGKLVQHADYVITNDMYIAFNANYPFEVDEVFECTIIASPVGEYAPVTTKSVVKTYTLAIGQTVLPLDYEYNVNENPTGFVGQIKVYVDGVLALRNTGNSSTVLDKTYYEPNSTTGVSSQIIFNTAPVGSAKIITVDFGVRAIISDDTQSQLSYLVGALQNMASDLAMISGKQLTDYFTPSATETQRREFGNAVLDLQSRVGVLELIPSTQAIGALDVNWALANQFSKSISANSTFTFSNNQDGKIIVVRLINSSASALTLTWPASVLGAITTLTASKTGVYTFIQFGTNIYMTGSEY